MTDTETYMTGSAEIPEVRGWTFQDELERVIGEVLTDPSYRDKPVEIQTLILANAVRKLMEGDPS